MNRNVARHNGRVKWAAFALTVVAGAGTAWAQAPAASDESVGDDSNARRLGRFSDMRWIAGAWEFPPQNTDHDIFDERVTANVTFRSGAATAAQGGTS
ncbi:MAG: hypothetical protein V3T70_00965 [Phycisphaerae bacterium]